MPLREAGATLESVIWAVSRLSLKEKPMKEIRPATHPGIILKLEFAEPLNLTQARIGEDIGVGIKTLSEL